MTEPANKKINEMNVKEAFQAIREAQTIKAKIEQGTASAEEKQNFETYHSHILRDYQNMIQPLGKALSIAAETVSSAGKKIGDIVQNAIEQQKEAYESGRYFTYQQTENELIFIVDGKAERKRYPIDADVDAIVTKSRKMSGRTYIFYTIYELLREAQEGTPKRIQELIEQDFIRLSQDTHTNELSRMLNMQPDSIDMYGTAKIARNGVTVTVRNWNSLTAKTSTIKTLDFFVFYITENNLYDEQTLYIPLEQYMKIRGLKDTKANRYTAKTQLMNDLEILKSIMITWKKTKGVNRGDFVIDSLIEGKPSVINGIIKIELSRDFRLSLPPKQYMYLPPSLFSTDDGNYPHAYKLMRRMSLWKRSNFNEEYEHIISGKTLIECCGLEKHKNIPQKRYKQLVLQPLINNLEYLEKHFDFEWNFQQLEPTEDGEHWQEKIPASYEELAKAKIVFDFATYPEEKTKGTREKKEKFNSVDRELKNKKKQKKKLEKEIVELIEDGREVIKQIKRTADKVKNNVKPN